MAHQLVKKAAIQPHTSSVNGCAISPDGTLLATGSEDMSICIINIATQAKVYTVQYDGYMSVVAWSPDGTRLVAVTFIGTVVEVRNNKAHLTVYKCNASLFGCAFSPSGILAVGGEDKAVTLFNPFNKYSIIEKLTGLSGSVYRVAFSPDGNILVAGCHDGHMYIYGLTNGKWAQVSDNNHHSSYIFTLCFSPSGRMLLATSGDNTASIWNVPNGTTWSSTPHVTLKGHADILRGGAFLGDESHVITGSQDKSLRIWRTSDGVQTANYECGERVRPLSYHAASGNIIVGLKGGHVEMWQTDPYIAPAPQTTFKFAPQAAFAPVLHAAPQADFKFGGQAASEIVFNFAAGLQSAPQAAASTSPLFNFSGAPRAALSAHVCVRERLAEAKAQVKDIEASIEKADSGLRQQMSREQELKRSIADLEAKLASEKKALEELQTPEYIALSRDAKVVERHNELLGIIHVCTQTLDSLTDCLSVSGLEDLRDDTFKEWLCDIGMCKLQTALKDIDGVSLTMLNVGDVMDYGVSFSDAAALQLRGYIAHHKLSADIDFAPPRGSVLSWDEMQTANWIKTLGAPYGCLSSAGWHGAALCSLSPPRVIEASKGALKVPDAVKFINLVKAKRNETDGDKATWVSKWSGTTPIDNQAQYS